MGPLLTPGFSAERKRARGEGGRKERGTVYRARGGGGGGLSKRGGGTGEIRVWREKKGQTEKVRGSRQ